MILFMLPGVSRCYELLVKIRAPAAGARTAVGMCARVRSIPAI